MKNPISITFLAILLFLSSSITIAQNNKIDSLKLVITNAQKDTNKVRALNSLAQEYRTVNYDTSLIYAEKALKLSEELIDKKGIINSFKNIGISYYLQGDYNSALNSFLEELKIKKELGDKKTIAASLLNIGAVYDEKGDYANAIDYYTKCLKTSESIGFKKGIAYSLNNIGVIYLKQDDFDRAREFFYKSLTIKEELGDDKGIPSTLGNIGSCYKEQNNYLKALEYYNQSLILNKNLKNQKGVGRDLSNIGSIYNIQKKYTLALEYLIKSLNIRTDIGDKLGETSVQINIGDTYFKLGEYEKAIDYCINSLNLAKEIGAVEEIMSSAKLLSNIYKQTDRFKESLAMFELYIQSRDSVESEENQKEVIRQEYKYQYEKQALADSIKTAEEAKVKDALLSAEIAENKQRKQQAYFLYGGLFLALLFGAFIFNRFKVTQKQKGIIEEQKQIVDEAYNELGEKNEQIMDSITYAKRIQSAILPPSKLVKEYLKDSFILYKPKDIVAGDFYWMEHQDGKVLFAAADCTGHGVPGAMVSVVCNNALNRSVREYGLKEPGAILDKTREIVIQEFEKSDDEVNDGMDIALCTLEGNKLSYAGAHNPLWIIRNGEILETKANKQPIGKYDDLQPYLTHSFELQEGDSIYIFSDGYVDQFGGEKGKKLKAKAFKELLLGMQNEELSKQRTLLDQYFESWRGELEQIDDVVVIGVKV